MQQTLQTIPLDAIQSTLQNPRSDLEEDDALRGLAASLGEQHENLVSSPTLEFLEDGSYRILAGERRVKAARLAGWTEIECIIRPKLAPEQAHRQRLAENLHRQDLHPLDRAVALKIEWFFANAAAMGLSDTAREILSQEQTPQQSLDQLSTLLTENEFTPTHPAITWDEVLDQLGVELSPARRKKLLQILSIEPDIQKRAREKNITEAALRSLGQLEPNQQAVMMQEIEDDPTMARKVRRISHAVRSHDYELEDAIAEAKGHLIIDGEEVCNLDRPRYAPEEGDDSLNDLTMEIVLAWLDAANQVTEVSKGLVDLLNGRRPDELSAPWGQYTLEGIEMIAQALTPFVTFAKLANESNHNHPHPHPHQH